MNGYEMLKAAVVRDCNEGNGCFNENGCDKQFTIMAPAEGAMKKYSDTVCKMNTKCTHKYCDKFKWVIDRAKQYADKTGLNWEDILNKWEEDRDYWYMNYYQECNQPSMTGSTVKIFDSLEDLRKSIGNRGFRCPCCGGVSTSPYECNSGIKRSDGTICNWKSYGLFKTLGKGASVFVKDQLHGETFFMPVAWEAKS